MRFTINLATKNYINHRMVNGAIYGTGLILLVLLAWNVQRLFTATGEKDRLKADISKYEDKLNQLPSGVSAQEFQNMQSNIRFYNNIIAKKTTDWIGLLDKMEKVTPPGIALTSFAPDPKTAEIKIEGEAKTFAAVRSYLERLEESKLFRDIQLLSHQDNTATEKNKGVKFAISFLAVTQ